jgi:anthranilate/para-aminobenzoate synthase component II
MADESAARAREIPPCPRTLILDFRDSYTANLLTLFSTLYPPTNPVIPLVDVEEDNELGEQGNERIADKVVIVQADTLDLPTYLDLLKEKEIDCVILSPGPGRADREEVSTQSLRRSHSRLIMSPTGCTQPHADHRQDGDPNIRRVFGHASYRGL